MKYQCAKCETIFEQEKYLTECDGEKTCPICDIMEVVYKLSNPIEKFRNKIIQGNCTDLLKQLPENSIDLVITSPPYNLGNDHHTGNNRHSAYNDSLPENEYQEWQIEIMNLCYDKLKENGSMIYNHKNRIKKGVQIEPYQWIYKTKFIIKQELIWFNRSQNFDKIRFYPMTERIYWLTKKADTKLFNVINKNDLFNWQAEGTDKEHTRAFPVDLPSDFIQCFPDAKIILDPFGGSGTVAVACIKNNRDYILFEQDKNYCAVAEERIKNEKLKLAETCYPEDLELFKQ